MKVVKNYLWNVSYQIFVIIVPMITMPYISRVLGPHGVGVNSFTNSIVQYFVLFGGLGLGLYGNREIAYVRDDKKQLSKEFWELLILRTVTMTSALVIYIIMAYNWREYRGFLFIQSIQIIAAIIDISWFFMGIENFRITVLRNLLVKSISVICIFLFVKSRNDTGVYIAILALSTLFGNLTVFPYLKTYITRIPYNSISLLRHLKPSIYLFIPQIAIQIYVVLNKTMLGQMVSVDAAGFYDSSDKIIRLVLAIVTGTGTVLLPHIANQFIKGHLEQVRETFTISFQFVTLISLPIAFGLAAISSKFVYLFLGGSFEIVGLLLQIEAIAGVFIAWDNALGQQYLLPTGQTSRYTIAVVTGALVNIFFNAPFILFWKTVGSMWATVLSEVAVTLVMLFYVRQKIKIASLYHEFWKIFVACSVMFLSVSKLDSFLKTSWLSLCIEVAYGAVIYLLAILVFKPKIIQDFKNFVNARKF